MSVTVLHLEAFASQPGQGNPAGVVLSAHHLDEAKMQAIAQAVGFSETAFILPSGVADHRIRYFTPGHEVDLCGHATVASLIALHRRKQLKGEELPLRVTVETLAGVISVDLRKGGDGELFVVMSQAPARFVEFQGSRSGLAAALGLDEGDLHPNLPIVYGSTGLWTLVVPIRALQAVQRMRPATASFPGLLTEMPRASIHPFCLQTIDPLATVHARHFSSPYSGTVEDPVTGTASGVLGAYHQKYGGGREDHPFLVEQGAEVGRNGRVRVWAKKEGDSYAVSIGGTGCFVQEFQIDPEQLTHPAKEPENAP